MMTIILILIYFLLIVMFFLGAAQLLWGIIHPIVTKDKGIRKHYVYYWLGVVAYCIGMSPAFMLDSYPRPLQGPITVWCFFFFFVGAWALAIYQMVIISWQGKLKMRTKVKTQAQDLSKVAAQSF